MTVKKILATMAVAAVTFSAMAEVPSIMVMPGKTWANAHNYLRTEEHNGKTRYIIDYDRAFMDPEFHNAEQAVHAALQDYQVKPISYNAQSENDDLEDADDIASDLDGDTAEKSNRDDLYSHLKGDVQIIINWVESSIGFDKSISFDMTARDTYSGQEFATTTGESPTVSKSTPMTALLKATVQDKMPEFMLKVQNHFDDLVANGRVVTVQFQIKAGSGTNFTSDVNGKTLGAALYDWMAENTVNGKFNERSATKNRLRYNQVRIPTHDERGNALNVGRYLDRAVTYIRSLGLKAENRSPMPGVGIIAITD